MLTGIFIYRGGSYSFSAENISHSETRIVGYSSHCFNVRVQAPAGGRIKVKLRSKKWVEEYDRHAPVPWPDLRSNNLEKIVSTAIQNGWDQKEKFDLVDLSLGAHATVNQIEELQRSDSNPLPIQSLSF